MSCRGISVRSGLLPGVIDAAAASLATFAAGLFAARYLPASMLGIYAMFMAAFGLAVVFSWRLVFVSFEVELLALEAKHRRSASLMSLRFGVPVAFAATSIILVAWAVTATRVGAADTAPFAITATAAALLSPIQDHMRRVQHLADSSWRASIISIVQVVTAGGFIAVALIVGMDPLWVPFGSLAVANTLSLTVALFLSWRGHKTRPDLAPTWRGLMRSGRWLLIIGLLPAVAVFVASLLVLIISGSEILGYAEAGRIVSRPLTVLISGFGAVISPRAMEAGRAGDGAKARSATRVAYQLIPVAALVMILAFGINWSGNPLSRLIPNAYEISGLVALAIAANAAVGVSISQQSQLIGGGREVKAAAVTAMGAAATVIVTASTFVTRAYAIPLGVMAGALARWYGYEKETRSLYASSNPPAAGDQIEGT